MAGGRFRVFRDLFRRGKEVHYGTGQALRQAIPLETEADEAMQRCIDELNHIEFTLTKTIRGDGDVQD